MPSIGARVAAVFCFHGHAAQAAGVRSSTCLPHRGANPERCVVGSHAPRPSQKLGAIGVTFSADQIWALWSARRFPIVFGQTSAHCRVAREDRFGSGT